MEEKIIRLLKDSVKVEEGDEYCVSNNPNLKGNVLSKDNFVFYPGKGSESKDDNASGAKIAFIDGSNNEVLGSSGFSLSMFRIAYVVFQGNKKTKIGKKEFYSLITVKDKMFSTKVFSEDGEIEMPVIAINEKSLAVGRKQIPVQKISEQARRYLEIMYAEKLVEELNSGDVIVMDGSLEDNAVNEKEMLDNLFSRCSSKNVMLCGLCKTNRIITNKGRSVNVALKKLLEENSILGKDWYYADLFLGEDGMDSFIVNLHPNSKYSFKLDAMKGCDISLMMGLLSDNSKDMVFLGYPYGLVLADKLARITNEDVEGKRTRFKILAGKDWKYIEEDLRSIDAHDILDRM